MNFLRLKKTLWVLLTLSPLALLSGCSSGGDGGNIPVTTYTIGGTLTGLAGGESLLLQNNGADDLLLTTEGPFTFATPVIEGGGYNVTIKTNPGGQQCTVVDGGGSVTANVNTIDVQCFTSVALEAHAYPGAVRLNWSDSGAASYDLYYSTDPACDINFIDSCAGGTLVAGVSSPHDVSGLGNGTLYTFWLKAGYSGAYNIVSISGARPNSFAANGSIQDIAIAADGTVYLGGDFTRVGAVAGGFAALRTESVGVAPSPLVDGMVVDLVSDGAGGWYIGGSFTQVDGIQRNNIAHVLADGSVGPWNPGADGPVIALALSGTTLYTGGIFTTIGGQPRNSLAALDTTVDTNNATDWDPAPTNALSPSQSFVNVLALNGTTIYVGGTFTDIGGAPRNNIAALDTTVNTGNATDWDPNTNGGVESLALSGSTLYVGGRFNTIGGLARNGLAALDTTVNTNMVTAWDPAPISVVGPTSTAISALALDGTTLYVGGYFTDIGGAPRNNIAALDTTVNTGNATDWDPNARGGIYSLVLSGSTLYVGGYFSEIGGQPRRGIAALDTTVAINNATAWNITAGQVHAIGISGGTVYVGGNLGSIGGIARNYLAALDPNGNPTAWNPNADAMVWSLALSGTTLYVGGNFSAVDGLGRRHLAAIDTTRDTANITAWDPGTNGSVLDLAVSGNTVYAGGGFATAGGVTRNNIAALDATTGAATAWNPDADNTVWSIAVSGTTVYAGGDFLTIGGQPRNRIAALDTTVNTANATAWNPGADAEVSTLAVDGASGTLYAGGRFHTIGGLARNGLAALDVTVNTNSATPWDPAALFEWEPLYILINALALDGTTLYVGGTFSNIGGAPRNNIAALDTTVNTGNATNWNHPGVDSQVNALVIDGTTVHAGGHFTGGYAALPK